MDLLEYQAKELFAQCGIPVLPSQQIHHPKDLKGLKIPYPVVLKSQVRRGGRGRAGGIRFVKTTIDAIAAAQAIFNLPIMGEYPEVILAEAKYDTEQEFYLAVVLDRSLRRPVLLGSRQGGIKVEATLNTMQRVVVDQPFSAFYARRLAIRMGLDHHLILSVSSIVEKMYTLFMEKDLDAVEINPLAVSATGEVMALDGKVTANDNALNRHDDLMALADQIAHLSGNKPIDAQLRDLNLIELEGDIGILCNGAGLTMATLDNVCQKGGRPGNCLNIGRETSHEWQPSLFQKRLQEGLDLVGQARSKVILLNLLCYLPSCDEVAKIIVDYVQHRGNTARSPHLVVRLSGKNQEQARDRLLSLGVVAVDQMEEAIGQAIALAQKTKSRSRSSKS